MEKLTMIKVLMTCICVMGFITLGCQWIIGQKIEPFITILWVFNTLIWVWIE
jgi:hypothetical protein